MTAQWLPLMVDVDDALTDTLNHVIDTRLAAEEAIREDEYQARRAVFPPGTLSPTQLANPLQHQVLKTLGCPPRAFDAYAYRLFKRGRDIEAWFVSQLDGEDFEEQPRFTYRDVLGGHGDVLMRQDGKVYPWEVKSVKNSKFKRILSQGPDRSHCLQSAACGLGVDAKTFSIIYIAADDLRVKVYTDTVQTWRPEVDAVLDRFLEWCTLFPDTVPVFAPEEKWQGNAKDGTPSKYNPYPDWANLNDVELAAKVEKERETWTRETPTKTNS